MVNKDRKALGDILGAGRLTIDAIAGVTDIAEGLHHAILSFGGVLDGGDAEREDAQRVDENAKQLNNKRTTGVSGLVYRSIRHINTWLGLGLDALIQRLTNTIANNQASPGRAAVVSVFNGILGDHLQRKGNPLAITMAFCRDGNALNATELVALLAEHKEIALFVHGLCMNDQQWTRRGHNHGELLATELGFTPLYLRYNTGLHTSENGRALAELMDMLGGCGGPDTAFYIVAHSMGGLVSRSAYHYGTAQGQRWPEQLRKIVFLGTPHHGAALERGGNWINVLLDSNPYSSPFSRLAKIRSSGITDLRYGNVLDEDWAIGDRFAMAGDQRRALSLPKLVDCYAIAATTSLDTYPVLNNMLGDGLVSVTSALGQHRDSRFNLNFYPDRQWLGRGLHHMDLLNDAGVYSVLKSFLEVAESEFRVIE